MGRTVTPYSRQMQQVESGLLEFRRGLRKPDQEIFDDLIRVAKLQVQAGVMASGPYPIDTMLMTMMIHLKKEISKLKQELNELRAPKENV
ncbi:hypothetical protein DLM76_10140 [Leptospira yasudae]|uniref:DUF8156 domain-containing protein n=1 Tax=Leptospira yasudae TaxID=2202201 RepID=A0A5F2E5E2_9LEPT|nr:hypothetical protein [Leptospira yasudae]MBW0433767.1 hypothetical protein [Leptospira yasudae]RHX80747.1 hypothetical protein DLM77_07625 [Leptospira yasudae]RHX94429.1 hypothetical protein DLM76_10140 [Leptospira yasudae]TGK24186.1 hypothetical protein EHQ05_14735 [Leptospira yasudae]TGL83045.1 hypothetical protein EHQ77_01955 [Leptospira yasudae]